MIDYILYSIASTIIAYESGYFNVDFRSTVDYLYGLMLDRMGLA